MKRYVLIAEHLQHFLEEEVRKIGKKNVVLGLSGGIDSAVVAVLASRVFGDNLLCVKMPSHYSSQNSIRDADEFSLAFNLRSITSSIEPMLRAYEEANPDMDKLRKGNLSARLRMSTIFDLSAKHNALVLGTSNKSELLLGYGTLYGDLACALNPIGDLYKSEVYELAQHLGVTNSIIKKAPSADLWDGQSDEADLGYTYAQLDEVLKLYIEEQLSREKILEMGYDAKMLDMIIERNISNQFKGKMPLIAKLANYDFN